jgi:hypothetical protein
LQAQTCNPNYGELKFEADLGKISEILSQKQYKNKRTGV